MVKQSPESLMVKIIKRKIIITGFTLLLGST